jgi:hypothetical protein
LFKNLNEWQKNEQVPIPLPRALRNGKTRNGKKNLIIGHQRESHNQIFFGENVRFL